MKISTISQHIRQTSRISIGSLALAAMAEGQATRATRLLGAAAGAREAIGWPLPPSAREEQDQISAAARSKLDGETFAVAWSEGQVMSLEQAVAYAFQDG